MLPHDDCGKQNGTQSNGNEMFAAANLKLSSMDIDSTQSTPESDTRCFGSDE
jgi:hypothetical protein